MDRKASDSFSPTILTLQKASGSILQNVILEVPSLMKGPVIGLLLNSPFKPSKLCLDPLILYSAEFPPPPDNYPRPAVELLGESGLF